MEKFMRSVVKTDIMCTDFGYERKCHILQEDDTTLLLTGIRNLSGLTRLDIIDQDYNLVILINRVSHRDVRINFCKQCRNL